jgi:hypothetical protein
MYRMGTNRGIDYGEGHTRRRVTYEYKRRGMYSRVLSRDTPHRRDTVVGVNRN